MRLSLRLLLGLWLLCASSIASATIESDLVKQGVGAYNDLDYQHAVELLTNAIKTESLTREEKSLTLQTLAFSHVALVDMDAAVNDFEQLLLVDPAFDLDRTISPRIRAALEQARARLATGASAGTVKTSGVHDLKPTASATRLKAGQPFEVKAGYPGGLAEKATLYYRTRGQGSFSTVNTPVGEGGEFALTVPGMQVHAPGLEYYMVVLDEAGSALAGAGSLSQPLSIEVDAEKKPVYRKAWFWGVVGGAVAVGAGVAVAMVLTQGSGNGMANIIVQPH